MAEMQVADKGGKGGKPKAKKMSTRVDLTPMVDLGFLLITFFMLATTLAKPKIMRLVMPKKDKEVEEQPPVKESKVLTLILGNNDKVYYYEGITEPKLDSTDYSASGVRKMILEKITKVNAQWGLEDYDAPKKDDDGEVVLDANGEVVKEKKQRTMTTVLIKPTENAKYKNVVDALDEMNICNVAHYVILDVSDEEKKFIANPAAGMNLNEAAQKAAALN